MRFYIWLPTYYLHDNVFSLAVEKTLRAINSNSVILSKNDILAYYKTACHTSAIDVVRTEKSQKRDIGLTNSYNVVLGDGEGTEMVSLLPNNNSPLADSLVNHSDMVKIIDSEMARLLSDDENLLIRAFYFEQKKLEEIVSENGMPLGTVKGSLHRAKAKLKGSGLLASVFK